MHHINQEILLEANIALGDKVKLLEVLSRLSGTSTETHKEI